MNLGFITLANGADVMRFDGNSTRAVVLADRGSSHHERFAVWTAERTSDMAEWLTFNGEYFADVRHATDAYDTRRGHPLTVWSA